MQKKSNDDLIYILNFLYKGRENLIFPFLDKDYELIGKTFKYERNRAAFDLVRSQFLTLWLDKHFIKLLEEKIPESIRLKILSLLFCLIDHKEKKDIILDNSEIEHVLLSNKIKIIKEILNYEDNATAKYNELKFSYEKDKALFEREFLRQEEKIKMCSE